MKYFIGILILSACYAVSTLGLQCFQCGQYNDGVGSITPCINETAMVLKDCPRLEQTYCIKYISEGSTVRDCVNECEEKETWGTRTYCCTEDGCNSALVKRPIEYFYLFIFVSLIAYLTVEIH